MHNASAAARAWRKASCGERTPYSQSPLCLLADLGRQGCPRSACVCTYSHATAVSTMNNMLAPEETRTSRAARGPSCLFITGLAPCARWLPRVAFENAGEVFLGFDPHRECDLHQRHAGADEHLLSPFDPTAQEVFVRPKARGRPELRCEMHARKAGRRSDLGKAHGLIEARLDIVDGSLQPPWRKLAPPRSLGSAHATRRGQEPCDDGHADAVRVDLSERAINPVGFKQSAPQPIDHDIFAWNGPRAKYRRLVAGYVAGAFGDQGVRYVQVQDIVRPAKEATNG